MIRMEAFRSENKQELQNLIYQIERRFDGMSETQKVLAHEEKSNSRHEELTKMLQVLAAASHSTSSASSSRRIKHSVAVSQRPKTALKGSAQRRRLRKNKQHANRGSSVLIDPESQTDHFTQRLKATTLPFRRASTGTSTAADSMIHSDRHIVSDWLLLLFLLSLTTVYQTTFLQRMTIAQLQAARQDPLLAALLSSVIVALLRRFVAIPWLITGISDDSVSLQTALGEDLVVPSIYWQSREILHGFLESHFRERPGRLWVMQKCYRILLGGTAGIIIDDSRWSRVITGRMKLTMAIVLDRRYTCPTCNEELADTANPEVVW